MELLNAKDVVSTSWQMSSFICWRAPFRIETATTARIQRCCSIHCSRKSDFQVDFQNYARPLRLLPTMEVKVWTDSLLEMLVTSPNAGALKSTYKIKLQTSNTIGSDLTDVSAGILVCLIDENGDSILQRLPASLMKEHHEQSEDVVDSHLVHFQKGSVDEFIFRGPKLGKVEAIWIAPESGQWILGGVSLTVCDYQPPLEDNDNKDILSCVFEYYFELEDVLLGEGSDMSMLEIRPRQVNEYAGDDILTGHEVLKSGPSENYNISNEESMIEYADLKYSLLFYDSALIIAGSLIATFSAGENAAFAFLSGGIGGFMYLLLLQRSVDGLTVPDPILKNGTKNVGNVLGRFKESVTGLVLGFAFPAVAVQYVSRDGAMILTPEELLFGMTGFFMCKVSVLLAAFKPMKVGLIRERSK